MRDIFAFMFKSELILPINHTIWWVIKVKPSSLDIHENIISLMELNNVILMLHTCIILSPSFDKYFSCIPFGKFSDSMYHYKMKNWAPDADASLYILFEVLI